MKISKIALKLMPFILFVFAFFACGKKTQVTGVVYSTHNIPVPNVSITLRQYRASSYPERTYTNVATTNYKGEYQYNGKLPSNYSNELEFNCDSGYARTQEIKIGTTIKIDIHLQ